MTSLSRLVISYTTIPFKIPRTFSIYRTPPGRPSSSWNSCSSSKFRVVHPGCKATAAAENGEVLLECHRCIEQCCQVLLSSS